MPYVWLLLLIAQLHQLLPNRWKVSLHCREGSTLSAHAIACVRPDLMRDRKRRSKTENGVFRSGFFDQKKKSYLRKAIYIFLIEKSRSKNDVFRFRSAFSISHKIGSKIAFFSDRKIQIEKRRFSFSISHKIGPKVHISLFPRLFPPARVLYYFYGRFLLLLS